MAEVFTNLARSTLASGITAGATSLTVQSGDGNDLFPSLAGSDFFRAVLFKRSTGEVEIIRVTARSGDVLTITRAQEDIGNVTATAYAFNSGDIIELRPTAAFFASIGGLSSTSIQQLGFNFGADGGSVNAYSVTLSPTPGSYASPLPIAFLANATNTGAATLEEAGLGSPKSIERLTGEALRPGDIVVNEVAYCLYDTAAATFKLINPRSSGEAADWTFDQALAIGGVASFDAVHDYGSETGVSKTINWNNGNKQEITLAPSTGNDIAFTFTAPPGPTDIRLTLKQDATGNRTVSWPASCKFIGGIDPVLSSAASAVDIATIYYDGSFYYVSVSAGWAA